MFLEKKCSEYLYDLGGGIYLRKIENQKAKKKSGDGSLFKI